jgi:Domain of unknown function (DUF4402)
MVKARLTISEGVGLRLAAMVGLRLALLSCAALLGGALAMPDAAPAQCRLCANPTTDAPSEATDGAVRIEVQARLDFDQLVLMDSATSGVARLLPDGTASVSGSLGVVSGRAMVGSVVVRGEPGRLVRIGLPSAIALYGRSGGTIRLQSLVSDLPAQPRLDSQGSLRFRFGGELHVQGDASGDYRGDVPITVDYL